MGVLEAVTIMINHIYHIISYIYSSPFKQYFPRHDSLRVWESLGGFSSEEAYCYLECAEFQI